MSTTDEIDQMIEDILQREEKLSEWEASFIDSIESQLRRGRSLTEKQDEKLTAIWERVT